MTNNSVFNPTYIVGVSSKFTSPREVKPSTVAKTKGKAIHVKVVSLVRIEPNGSHTIISTDVNPAKKPVISKVTEPDLVMKSVKRYLPNGEFCSNGKVIDINKSLAQLGLTLDELLSSHSLRGSAEHRVKIAYKATKTMTPEYDDVEISIGQR